MTLKINKAVANRCTRTTTIYIKIYVYVTYKIYICYLYNVKEMCYVKGFQYFHTTKCKLLFLHSNRVYGQLFAYFNSAFPSPLLFCTVYAKMITMAALRCTCKLKSVKDFAIHDAHLSARKRERESEREKKEDRERRKKSREEARERKRDICRIEVQVAM